MPTSTEIEITFEQADKRVATRPSVKPQRHGRRLRRLASLEEPEEHVRIVVKVNVAGKGADIRRSLTDGRRLLEPNDRHLPRLPGSASASAIRSDPHIPETCRCGVRGPLRGVVRTAHPERAVSGCDLYTGLPSCIPADAAAADAERNGEGRRLEEEKR